jgi:hypothetical protein
MNRRRIKRFLLSGHAIEAHLVFPFLIVVLSVALWNGNARHNNALALAFTVIAYPTLLFLSWLADRQKERDAIQYQVEYHTAPEKLRRTRRRWRLGAFAALMAVAWLLLYFGEKGLRIDSLPAQYLGYILLVVCLLGAAGVNIWYGGPLDPRGDPPGAP